VAIRRRRLKPDEASFQLTPMIDMTFLLLIFFMVTTKMSKEKVKMDVTLPTASAAVMPEDLSNRDIINIDGRGAYYVGEKEVSKEDLASYLKERFKNSPPLRIYLRADKNTPTKTIREFMKMATEAGAANVIFGSYGK
jgi:biopolymer transport protein ExbD